MAPQISQAERLGRLLDEARTRLVETGTRNRLVHTHRKSKKPTTLTILHPDPDAAFKRLVVERANFHFLPDPLATERERRRDPEDDQEEVFAEHEPLVAPHQGDVLQTRLGESGLQKKLTRFYREAKTLEEEQGVNILFLAMGFLRWYEDEASNVVREGPLVLVPVSLARDSKRSTYTLRA